MKKIKSFDSYRGFRFLNSITSWWEFSHQEGGGILFLFGPGAKDWFYIKTSPLKIKWLGF